MNETAELQHQGPYWDYQDLILFIGFAPLSLLVGALAAKAVTAILPVSGEAPRLLLIQFLGYGCWFASLFGVLKLRYDHPFWSALGWVLPETRPWLALASSAAVGPFLALSVATLGVLLRTPERDMPINKLMQEPASIALVGVFAITAAPAFEELAFRGFLMPLLVKTLGTATGIAGAAIPFALLHGQQYAWSWQHLLLLAGAGAVFGVVRHRTGSTLACVLTHATYNLTFLVLFLMKGD